FFFSSRRRHTRFSRDWSSDVCSSDLGRRRRGVSRARENRAAGQVRGRGPGADGGRAAGGARDGAAASGGGLSRGRWARLQAQLQAQLTTPLEVPLQAPPPRTGPFSVDERPRARVGPGPPLYRACCRMCPLAAPARLNVFGPAVFGSAVFGPGVLGPAVFGPAEFHPAVSEPAVIDSAVFDLVVFLVPRWPRCAIPCRAFSCSACLVPSCRVLP